MKKYYLLFPLFIAFQSSGQSFFSNIMVHQDTTFNIHLGGFLDGKNCQIQNKYWVAGYVDHQRIAAIEPMDSVVVVNVGNTDIEKIQIITKENNIYSLDSIANDAISSLAQTGEDTVYGIYKYMTRKHFYFYVPEPESREFKEVTKFFGIYGYGHCGAIANCVTLLTKNNNPLNQLYWQIDNNSHAISELYLNGKYYYVDADEEMLIKGRNNKNYVSFGEAYEDLFLFYRSKSFGPCEPYSFSTSAIHSAPRYMNNINHASLPSYEYSGPCYPNDTIGNDGPELSYSLKSGEKIIISTLRDTDFDIHHYPIDGCTGNVYGYTPALNTALSAIYNVKSIYDLMATNSLSNKFTVQSNSTFDFANHTIKAILPSIPSVFEIKKTGLFPLVNGKILLQTQFNNASDSMQIEVSFDSLNWTHLQTLTQANNPNIISLSSVIDPTNTDAKYLLFVRVSSFNTSSVNDVIISDFALDLNYQISTFLYPSLVLGDNPIQIKLDSAANNQLLCNFYWKEDTSNLPPSPPAYPLFPIDNSTINVTNFPFTWEQINVDAEGDSIVEWQFQLSEHPDFRTVLANNFDYYSLDYEGPMANFFAYVDTSIAMNTFFNHNNLYYWHVRVRDERNAWSPWSPTWQFTVKTTMPIQNLKFELYPPDTTKLLLTWHKNILDSAADHYLIINNNSATALYLHPIQVNHYFTTAQSLIISPDTINFSYRGFALDAQNNYSAPSPIVHLPTRLDANLYQPISFTQIMDSLQHPFPNYQSLNRDYFLVYDTAYFYSSAVNELTPFISGKSMISICYLFEGDTIYKKQFNTFIQNTTPLLVNDYGFNNPVEGQLNIQKAKGLKKEIFNSLGQLVLTTYNDMINVERMHDGIYFLKINGLTKKFIVSNR